MRRPQVRSLFVLAVVALVLGAAAPGGASSARTTAPTTETADPLAVLRSTANQIGMGDPDLPPVGRHIDPRRYQALRANQTDLYRGAPFDLPYNARTLAVHRLERQLASRGKTGPAWTAVGPAPIPNGQTTPENSVSGRVTSIAVDPSDADVVYVGTANGGVWRSKDGGATWVPLMDDADSLAIGALALAPSDPSILYVGSGEGNQHQDVYAGVGVFRIDDANGTSPVVNGPFEDRVAGTGTGVGNGHAFFGDGIQGIAVDPANAARVFVAAISSGIGVGNDIICCGRSPNGADLGLYLTTNGTGSSPQFSKVAGGLPQTDPVSGATPGATDVRFLPGSSTTLLVGIEDVAFKGVADNGLWRTTTANALTPSFTHIALPDLVFNTRLAVSGTTVLVAAELHAAGFPGRLYKSTDGGATFPTTLPTANGFCGAQCNYDMSPAIDPGNTNKMLLGGKADDGGGSSIMLRATDGVNFSPSAGGLHADTHATVYAPGDTSIVYTGDDGGVFRSADGGATWSSRNTNLSATQFQSIAVHPTDPNFSIGGTQDNGTNFYRPNGTWTRVDFGDGGFAAIDQNATNTTDVTVYHTYFNVSGNLIGFARVTTTANAHDLGWSFFGCSGGADGNGIACAENPMFYAPLVLGPGNPDTVYFGTDRLHRSTDGGATNPVVSQSLGSGFTGRISAIAIAPTNDKVRIVGGSGGQVLGTTTGSSTLVNLDPGNTIPNKYVGRVVIDPNNADVAYVAINGFTGGTGAAQSHVWKTTNINGASTIWTARNAGLPDVPVNAMVVDPNDSNDLYIGTDIGVFASTNGGASWAPFGTGLPVVPVFDMAIASPGTGSEVLRVATHGRGVFEASLGSGGDLTPPIVDLIKPSTSVTFSRSITIKWNASDTGGSGLDAVDVRVKSARFDSGFGSFTQPTALQHLGGTSKVFTGRPGTSYCFSIRARDHAGNLSSFSQTKCTMVLVDDATLAVKTGPWTRTTGQTGAFLRTLTTSSARGASLTLTNLRARQVAVLVKECASCGTFSITYGGHTFIADTSGSGFIYWYIPATATVRTSLLQLKVTTSGKPVQIDAVLAPQVGTIPTGLSSGGTAVRR